MYVRVTIKGESDKKSSFWAEKLGETRGFVRYRRVNKEGEDFSFTRKDGDVVDKQDIIQRTLIISEKKAVIDKVYGTLRVVK